MNRTDTHKTDSAGLTNDIEAPPRTSRQMRHSGTRVPRSDSQAGDLIVINNDGNWGHVGLYAGNNTVIHAPRPGKTVETTPTSGYWEQYGWDVRRVL